MSTRFKICLAAWIATVVCSAFCEYSSADVYQVTDDWNVEITPAVKATVTPATSLQLPTGNEVVIQEEHSGIPATPASLAQQYRRIYESIPFNRAEYDVNPSYRHDATMEILTGNARHRTVVHHGTQPVVTPRQQIRTVPYRYNNPRWGLNYYFYFPYWNHRGLY